MPEYLKPAATQSAQVTEEVRRTVSEMLAKIERDGEWAIRHDSRELDDWDPPSFLVDVDAAASAEAALDEELRNHIAFAQARVRQEVDAP